MNGHDSPELFEPSIEDFSEEANRIWNLVGEETVAESWLIAMALKLLEKRKAATAAYGFRKKLQGKLDGGPHAAKDYYAAFDASQKAEAERDVEEQTFWEAVDAYASKYRGGEGERADRVADAEKDF